LDFFMKVLKVLTVSLLEVSLVAIAINSSGPFAGKMG
jgi:hypothetical protein